jgi:hypothetical protein
MSNIKFVYLYRDGANYKSWGEVIFSNPEQLPLNKIEERLVNVFPPNKLFVASQVSIPEVFLFLKGKFTKFDHCFHEFDCVETCEDDSTDLLGRSISDFLQDVELASKQGWKVFDILDRA